MSLPNPLNYTIYRGDPLPRPKLYGYALAGQGVIKYAENDHFRAAIVVAPGRIAGLPDYPTGVTLHHPRIPGYWLATVLDHARRAGAGDLILQPVEQMYHFHWLDNRWQVSVPKQDASAARVTYKGGHEQSIVLDLHSHVNMMAGYSSTDNNDEQGLRFYAVIGRIYSRPEICLRVGVYGNWETLDPAFLFDGLGPFVWSEDRPEWNEGRPECQNGVTNCANQETISP